MVKTPSSCQLELLHVKLNLNVGQPFIR